MTISLRPARSVLRALLALTLALPTGAALRAQTANFLFAQTTIASGFGVDYTFAIDHSGNLYVADQVNDTLVKIDIATGAQTTVISGQNIGAFALDRSGNIYAYQIIDGHAALVVFSPDGGGPFPVVTSGIKGISSIAIDSTGAIYIADGPGNVIDRVDPATYAVTVAVSGLNSPQSIAVDTYGNLYISQEPVAAGDPWLYELNSDSQLLPITVNLESVGDPITADPYGNIYVSDYQGNVLQIPAGTTTPKSFAFGFNQLSGIAVDGSGDLFFGQSSNSTVSIAEAQLTAVRLPATPVCPHGASNCGRAVTLNFEVTDPDGIGVAGPYASGPTNADFVLDTKGTTCGVATSGTTCTATLTFAPTVPGPRLGSFQLTGSGASTIAGVSLSGLGTGPQAAFSGTSPLKTVASKLNQPSSVAVDGGGNVFIADTGNQRLVEVTPSGTQHVTTLGGLANPSAVTVDGAGNILVANALTGLIAQYEAGTLTPTTVQSGLTDPEGLAIDSSGDIYISQASSGNVVRLQSSGLMPISILRGLNKPSAVAFDSSGNLYAVESGGNLVFEDITATFQEVTFGKGLDNPTGIAIDPAGNIYVSDTGNDRIVEFAPGGVSQHTILSGLKQPMGIALDKLGNLYIADTGNDRVVELVSSSAPTLTFPATQIGKTAAGSPQTLNVINIGNQPLEFSSVNYPADFPADFDANGVLDLCSGGVTIAPGASCDLAVNFAPRLAGALSESIKLADNSLNGTPAVQAVSLHGSALKTQTIVFLPPAKLTFGSAPINLASVSAVTSGLAIAFKVVSGPATLKGSVLTLTGAGSVVIEASQPGNSLYEPASPVKKTISVSREVSVITWRAPASIVAGTKLSSVQLDAKANVRGKFVYSPPAGTALAAGKHTLSVTFTPANTRNYLPAKASVTITVVN
jgi:sugar lactone lactonase YvrE